MIQAGSGAVEWGCNTHNFLVHYANGTTKRKRRGQDGD